MTWTLYIIILHKDNNVFVRTNRNQNNWRNEGYEDGIRWECLGDKCICPERPLSQKLADKQ